MRCFSTLKLPSLPTLLCLLQYALLLLGLSDAASSVKAPFQSIKSPAETIRDYEIHVPIISKVSNQDYPRRMVVEISQFKLHMELNQGLIHPKFTSHHFDEDGQKVVTKGHVNCFYQGRVEGHPKWQVSMTTCHGLQGSFGELWNRENFFHLEPLDGANPALEQAHALYSDDQYSERTRTCGTKSSHKPENTKFSPISSGFPYNKLRLQQRQVNGFYFVEWVLINDMAQYSAFNQNLTAVVLRGLAIANFVDMECTDPCCNAFTCTLRRGATCSHGPCCSSDCQFLAPGNTCRSASQECDLMEYCTGDSPDCPRDVYKQDVTACSQGQRFCFTGTCQSLDSQCQCFFRSRNSVPECYARSNILGTESGNCGTRNGQFVACDPEHAQCGQVMCDGGDFQRKEVSVFVTPRSRTIIVGSSSATCKTFSNSPTSDTVNPGLVPDGVKCGNQSLCVSQTCTAISALDYVQPCPLGRNGQTCADAGLCNNLNQCSCNVGFTGDSCEQLTGTPGGRAGVVAGAVIGTLLSLSLAIFVAVVVAVFLKSRKRKSTLPAVQGQGVTKQTGKHANSRTESNNYSLRDSTNNTTTVNVIRPSAPPKGGCIPPPTGRSLRPAPSPSKAAPTTRSAPHPRPSNPPPRPTKPPPSAAQKPSKLQQQCLPSNIAPSAASRKSLPPQKKPMAPARRQF